MLIYSFYYEYLLFVLCLMIFFFKQVTAYGLRISDWTSGLCSSDLDFVKMLHRHCRGQRTGDRREITNLVLDRGTPDRARFLDRLLAFRSEERRVGKGSVSTGNHGRSPYNEKTQ